MDRPPTPTPSSAGLFSSFFLVLFFMLDLKRLFALLPPTASNLSLQPSVCVFCLFFTNNKHTNMIQNNTLIPYQALFVLYRLLTGAIFRQFRRIGRRLNERSGLRLRASLRHHVTVTCFKMAALVSLLLRPRAGKLVCLKGLFTLNMKIKRREHMRTTRRNDT